MAAKLADAAGSLLVRYENNPCLRALIQLIPYAGGAGDTLLASKAQQIRQERTRVFFDELSSGSHVITDELIQSDEFLHCFFATAEAALRTRRSEKIKLFARLLKSSISGDSRRGSDELEELVSILDDLSFAEWSALLLLDRYSEIPRGPSENDLQWAWKFWKQFRGELTTQLLIPDDEFVSFMGRIVRTGLYEILTGYSDTMGDVGRLTPRFHRLKRLVAAEEK